MSLVSVICPFYKSKLFLAEAIESVLAQTYPRWELVLVDDGSRDGSLEIAQSFVQRCPQKIRILQHGDRRNHGSSAARNLGIADSGGEYLAFLDADDVYLPDKLAIQVTALERHREAAMTFAPAVRWHRWSGAASKCIAGSTEDFTVPISLNGYLPGSVIPGELLLETYLGDESQTPCTCSVLIRKEVALAAGSFEPEFRGLYDDQVFYAKLLTNCAIHFTAAPVAKYRQHDASCCATARLRGEERNERARFLDWLSSYRRNAL